MKKVFAIVAIAAMFVACNKPAQTESEAVDSVAVEVVEAVDSAQVVDSTLTEVADSVAEAVN